MASDVGGSGPGQAAPPKASVLGFTEASDRVGISAKYGFSNETVERYLESTPDSLHDLVRLSGGVAAGDIDRDGLSDLLILRGERDVRVYRNLGDGTFDDVSKEMGLELDTFASGPLLADFDGDGFLDLAIAGYGERPLQLWRNDEGERFVDITERAKFTGALAAIGLGAADVDGDGDLDLLVARSGHLFDPGEGDVEGVRQGLFWVNEGDGVFTDQTDALRYPTAETPDGELQERALSPNFADIDSDGDVDLLLTQDARASVVFRNEGSDEGDLPRFKDITGQQVADHENGTGAAVGDYDNDGDLDWFVSGILAQEAGEYLDKTGNRLYQNDGEGKFTDVAEDSGVRDGSWGWGACFADFNNDSLLDIFQVNGWGDRDAESAGDAEEFLTDEARLFLQDVFEPGEFVELAAPAGIADDGLGRGVVCFDYDADGDVDVLVTNTGGNAQFYVNGLDPSPGSGANYLSIQLEFSEPNRDAIGARVYVTTGAITQMRELRVGNHFVSHGPPAAHFGVRGETRVDEVRIVWPGGEETFIERVDSNQALLVRFLDR